jgi:hypothetical protein
MIADFLRRHAVFSRGLSTSPWDVLEREKNGTASNDRAPVPKRPSGDVLREVLYFRLLPAALMIVMIAAFIYLPTWLAMLGTIQAWLTAALLGGDSLYLRVLGEFWSAHFG